jgi:hypothetical protein
LRPDDLAKAKSGSGRSSKAGDVAQLVEHLLCKQGVVGSIPSISTMIWFGSDAVTGGIQVSIFCPAIPEKVCGVKGWMFASQAKLSWSRNVLCQGE